MHFIRKNTSFLLIGIAYIALSVYFTWEDQAYLSLFPIALLAIYFAIYYTEWTFLSLAFLTPISINIEEYSQSFGLFVPTEPLLFGFLILLLLLQIQKQVVPSKIWQNQLVWAIGLYLFGF